MLAGSLASAAVCGFPVFCLVCPIGLTFASAIALYRLIGFNEPAIEVLVFPALLVLELTVFRNGATVLSGRCVAIAAFPR